MTPAVPELMPMEDTLMKRQDMWKRGLRFIHKMTSGVVYSIVMHILLITAHTLLIFQILYTRGFGLKLFFNVFGFFYMYLMFGLGEIALRASIEERMHMCATMFGHLSHMVGCILLSAYKVPLNPIGAFVFFLRVPFFIWCFYVSFSTFIPALLEDDDSITQPLV